MFSESNYKVQLFSVLFLFFQQNLANETTSGFAYTAEEVVLKAVVVKFTSKMVVTFTSYLNKPNKLNLMMCL